jgi:hypothetical protein
MNLGQRYSRTFPGRIASCGEHQAVFTLASRFSQRTAEQIPRAVRVVFVKKCGGIVGVKNPAESSRVFGEVGSGSP